MAKRPVKYQRPEIPNAQWRSTERKLGGFAPDESPILSSPTDPDRLFTPALSIKDSAPEGGGWREHGASYETESADAELLSGEKIRALFDYLESMIPPDADPIRRRQLQALWRYYAKTYALILR